MKLSFDLIPPEFAVIRFPPEARIPGWASTGAFFSITRSPTELSIICEAAIVPPDSGADYGWRCLQLRGTFAFSEVGIAASLSGSLAAAGVGILIVSTFDTDYVLVKDSQLSPAVEALRRDGHEVSL